VKSFLKVSVSGTEEQRELLMPTMIESGSRGFEETDTHLTAYFEKPADEAAAAHLRAALLRTLRAVSANAEILFEEVAERNWNAEWEATIRPIEIGERIAIRPSWCSYDGDPGREVLIIDPKMSFGTGYHETTRLMLRLVEKVVAAGDVVLDIGTGTGVLAIAAVRLGAAGAVGTDTDDWAVENARENTLLNGVSGKVRILPGSVPEDLPSPPTMICANLTLNDLTGLLPALRGTLAPGGRLLISGLLANDRGKIGSSLAGAGFQEREVLQENEWLAICAV